MTEKFRDRLDAGRLLAQQLEPTYSKRQNIIVLGLPRGGVPVASEIAKALHAPLDICIVRKLGVPKNREVAMGAIASGGIMILNKDLVQSLNISQPAIEEVIIREGQELERRERLYHGDRSIPNLHNRTVILVDDGMATGSTLKAALSVIRQQQPAEIVVAVPVAPPDVCNKLSQEVDTVVCLLTPKHLYSISLWYTDFSPTSDQQVRELLAENISQLA